MKKYFLFAVLLLAGCLPGTGTPDENVMNDDTQNMTIEDNDPSNDDDAMMASAVYAAFSPEVLTDGEPKVLFFHAAWCPICREADATLQSIFSDDEPMLSVYKADYDAEAALKAKYGVTYQHTFVLVDGQGNVVRTVQGPTDEQLKALVGAVDA